MQLDLTDHNSVEPSTKSKKVGVRLVSDNTLSSWRAELDEYYNMMGQFESSNIDEIMRAIASMTSRVSQIRSTVVRNENRQTQSFRTREIDPFIEECDRQFKIWSRILSIHGMDWEMSKRDGL